MKLSLDSDIDFCFLDADWDSSRDVQGRPWLVFDPTVGLVVIADDYEWVNDDNARSLMLRKEDAARLAFALLAYACAGKELVVSINDPPVDSMRRR